MNKRNLCAVLFGAVLALTASCSQPNQTGEPADPETPEQGRAPAAAPSPFTYVKASNPGVGDQFGGSGAAWGHSLAVSRDGNTLAVGARLEDSAATGIDGDQSDNSARDAGAVYLFTRSAGGPWSQQAYIKASNTDTGDQFGYSLTLSSDGNTLAVSAYFEDSAATGVNGDEADNTMSNAGAVYVFARIGTSWSQQAYVKASNTGEPDDGDGFGYSVNLSGDGDTLAVGALGEDSAATGIDGDQADNSAGGAGAVYVYARNGGAWSQQAYIKASNTEPSDLFASSVALNYDGNTLAVGALDEDGAATGVNGDDSNNDASGAGAVYVYTRSGTTWSQQAYVKTSNMEQGDALGVSVALSADGNTLAAGALDEDGLSTGVNGDQSGPPETDLSTGAAYVYTRSGGTWSQQAYFKASNTGPNDQFGTRVALSSDGSTLAVLSPLEDGSASGVNGADDDAAEDAGAAYVFRRNGSAWSQSAYVKASNAEIYDEFGATVALNVDGSVLAVGSRGEDGGSSGIGGDQNDNSVRDAGAVYVLESYLGGP